MEKESLILTANAPEPSPGGPTGAVPAGLYIHVPFCRAKCPYCDFYSVTDQRSIPAYIDALVVELNLRRRMVPCVDTVYFGGGTPSVLAPWQIGLILERIDHCFAVSSDVEVTLEVNPGTVTLERLAAFRQAGINRLNIGLQSIDDATLVFLGRIHSASQGIDTFRRAREAGFDNVGLDLIYGIPGQTCKGWEAELGAVAQLAAEHLSCYTLTMEPGTPMAAKAQQGLVHPLDEKIVADLFTFTSVYLQRNGYRQYEISNFFRQAADNARDCRSRHNQKYWTLAPYLGFGPAAHSFMDNRRWWNHRSLDRYLADLETGSLPKAGMETLTREQRVIEFVYLGLRRTEGIDPAAFKSRFNTEFSDGFGPQVDRLAREGLVATDAGRIRLTGRGRRFLESVVDQLIG